METLKTSPSASFSPLSIYSPWPLQCRSQSCHTGFHPPLQAVILAGWGRPRLSTAAHLTFDPRVSVWSMRDGVWGGQKGSGLDE